MPHGPCLAQTANKQWLEKQSQGGPSKASLAFSAHEVQKDSPGRLCASPIKEIVRDMDFYGVMIDIRALRSETLLRMKTIKTLVAAVLTGGLLTIGATLNAADHQGHAGAKAAEKAKPYPLKTCVVSGEKFGGDMGDPYVFNYQGREIKLCCKSCLKDFNKEPAKYVKKLEQAEKGGKPATAAPATPKAPAQNHSGHQH